MTSSLDHPDLEALAAFVDGTLPDRERSEVVTHLDRCSRCYEFVVGIARAVEDHRQEKDFAPGAGDRQREVRRVRWSSSPAWRLAAALVVACIGSWAIFRWYLPYQARLTYGAAMPKVTEISSIWLPLTFPAALEPTRGGASADSFALCGEPDDRRTTATDRACLEGLRRARARFQKVPRWARSPDDSRTLVALDLALGKSGLAARDLPAGWESDCILVMLQRFATADQLQPNLLADLRCERPQDQANVDLNRVLLLNRAGSTEEACAIWGNLTPSVRQSPVGRWHGPRCQ